MGGQRSHGPCRRHETQRVSAIQNRPVPKRGGSPLQKGDASLFENGAAFSLKGAPGAPVTLKGTAFSFKGAPLSENDAAIRQKGHRINESDAAVRAKGPPIGEKDAAVREKGPPSPRLATAPAEAGSRSLELSRALFV
jgi:hypothetical protein